jgi:hypothetical protein
MGQREMALYNFTKSYRIRTLDMDSDGRTQRCKERGPCSLFVIVTRWRGRDCGSSKVGAKEYVR